MLFLKVVFCLTGIEIIFRLLYSLKKLHIFLLTPAGWSLSTAKANAYEEHPYISYVKKRNVTSPRYPTNNVGYAGKTPTSHGKGKGLRIFVCGGSTAEQNDIDQETPFDLEFTWPREMEKTLSAELNGTRVEVINAGCSGYTSAESLIEFSLRGLSFNPDYAIFYHNINDAWLTQSIQGFRSDYSHARQHPNFQRVSALPDLRFSFLYQFIKLKIANLQDNGALIYYIAKKIPFESDFSELEQRIQVFKRNVRNFCAVCIANKVRPVLIPWQYDPELVQSPFGHDFSSEQLELFKLLLRKNNEALTEVAKEFPTCVLIDQPQMPKHCFRKTDWIHFSKDGLTEMANRASKALLPYLRADT